jgi:hypothetical protein
MNVPTISVVPFALWPLLTLAMVALWIVAMVDITGHRRRGTFTSAGLLCMAAAVSVVAVIAVAGIGAVFGQRFEAVSGAGVQADEPGGDIPRHTYLFSFGLEHVSYATPGKPKSTK